MSNYFNSIFSILLIVIFMAGCSAAYYDTLEKVGIHKRDILIDRIEDTQESQQEGQEQFASALEQFKSIVEVEPSNLEKQYNKLDSTYSKSLDAADEIRSNIKKVESVSKALFAEWKEEIKTYSNQNLKRDSQNKLEQTEIRYEKLMSTMRESESRLAPVLTVMHDQVLYLKHNLNARAIGSLENELGQIDSDITELIRSMKASISEADSFIKAIRGQS